MRMTQSRGSGSFKEHVYLPRAAPPVSLDNETGLEYYDQSKALSHYINSDTITRLL